MLNMKVDNPQAFRFIMQDEIYLLDKDKGVKNTPPANDIPVDETQPVVELSPPVIEQPVPEQITVTPEPQTPNLIVKTPETTFNYLGKNNKNFLVLVNYANEEYIAAAHLIALESILKRKDLNIDDVAILNVHKYAPLKLAILSEYFKPTRLVIMGKDSLPEGIGNLPLNQPLQGKKTHVLYSFSFDEMMSSNDNKKTFWEQMKTL
jgi:DNA polymerase III psi subunit